MHFDCYTGDHDLILGYGDSLGKWMNLRLGQPMPCEGNWVISPRCWYWLTNWVVVLQDKKHTIQYIITMKHKCNVVDQMMVKTTQATFRALFSRFLRFHLSSLYHHLKYPNIQTDAPHQSKRIKRTLSAIYYPAGLIYSPLPIFSHWPHLIVPWELTILHRKENCCIENIEWKRV